MKKVLDNSSSGAGGGKQLTEVDEAVLDILDRKTVFFKGLQEPDDPPIMSDGNFFSQQTDTRNSSCPGTEQILSFAGTKFNI